MAHPDRVSELFGAWEREQPDLDVATMITVGRVLAYAKAVEAAIATNARAHGVSFAEGDVLFALRRAGPPYVVAPSKLAATLFVPSGTLTGRLDRLERKGLIERVPDPADRRAMHVGLTERAIEGTDQAIRDHVELEQELIAPLSAREREQLDRLMIKLLNGVSPPGPAPTHL